MEDKLIWDYLILKINNPFAIAGIMGNLYAESSLNPKKLQSSYQTKLGFTNETYTQAIDSGTYTNFIYDSAGYGLAQWTYWSRKQQLFNYIIRVFIIKDSNHVSNIMSIRGMSLDFCCSYSIVYREDIFIIINM